MNSERIEELLLKNLDAANRTSNAVRGIAVFLLIEVTSTLIAAFLLALGIYFAQEFLLVLGSIVLLVGVIYAAVALKGEIDASRPSASSAASVTRRPIASVDRSEELGLENFSRVEMHLFSSLSEFQKDAWRKKGRPSLKNWDEKISNFEEWLESNPSH